MEERLEDLRKILGESRVRVSEPMSAHTTFKIGGEAELYMQVDKLEDLIFAFNEAKKRNIAVFVFGGGSNIIVSDKGIKGLVIKNNCRNFEFLGMSGRVKDQKIGISKALVYAESGAIMNQLVRFTVDQGLCGLEYQLGLPGTVGGAIYMNSNFPRKQSYVGDSLYSGRILSKDGSVREVDRSYFRFGYDKSILQETEEIVLSVVFKLLPMDKKILWERAMEALDYRTATQPKGASAGCTFRNISLVEAINASIPERITSAGFLIDRAGLKGRQVGDAMISHLHANFIQNMGKASADDVSQLVSLMKETVLKKFGVHLSLEVKTIGF